MAEAFLSLSVEERESIIILAEKRLRRSAHLLEKDVWVVWTLQTLFDAEFGEHLVFKGGTSLSKAYKVIQRFSEDVDITYDIRAIVPDMVGDNEQALPDTPSQEKRWTKEVRNRLSEWVSGTVQPVLVDAIKTQGLSAKVRIDGETLFIDYEASVTGGGYVIPSVKLDFGARSTGEPATYRDVKCDAAELIDGAVFPTARLRVMHAERTFWEKATAIHVFCLQQRFRRERFARHWHDLVRLDDAGIADKAMRDRALAVSVAKHKGMFFREKALNGDKIDYTAAVNGMLQLVPSGTARAELEADHQHMVDDDMFLGDAETFGFLVERCEDIAKRANQIAMSTQEEKH